MIVSGASKILAGSLFVAGAFLQNESGQVNDNSTRKAASLAYNFANAGLIASGFIEIWSRKPFTNVGVFKAAVALDILGGILSGFASTSDKKTNGRFRPNEMIKSALIISGGITYLSWMSSQNPLQKYCATALFVLQGLFTIEDGKKERDKDMETSGYLSVAASLLLLLVKVPGKKILNLATVKLSNRKHLAF